MHEHRLPYIYYYIRSHVTFHHQIHSIIFFEFIKSFGTDLCQRQIDYVVVDIETEKERNSI